MTIITNRHNLPQPIINALMKNNYSRGKAHISATQLIGSPRIRLLWTQNASKITEDAVDRLWALMGTALHTVLEAGGDAQHISEERLYLDVNGWRISGGIDLQVLAEPTPQSNRSKVALSDWKMTSAWTVMNGKADWPRQLGIYATLIEETKDMDVESISIHAIIRDWARGKARADPNYPQQPMITIPLPLASREDRMAYLIERVKVHQDAERVADWGDSLPLCTDEERWRRPGQLAVMKEGGKRALRVFPEDQGDEADNFAAEARAKSKGVAVDVVVRPGMNVRCADFCAVSAFCDQYQALKAIEPSQEESDE